jgi:hypothetical protein
MKFLFPFLLLLLSFSLQAQYAKGNWYLNADAGLLRGERSGSSLRLPWSVALRDFLFS